jgi:type I restriction enzyme S subunit
MTVTQAALGDVADFIRGITFKPEDVVKVGDPGSVACLRTKNVQADLDLTDVWGIPREFVKSPEKFVREGDLVISTANSWNLVGKASWIPRLEWEATAGGFVSLLRAKPERILPRYLYHWIVTDESQASLRKCARQTTNISNLSISQAEDLKIPLPPLEEQRRIAGILDQADALRRLRTRALDRLNTLGQAIFHEMFGTFQDDFGQWPVSQLESLVVDAQIGAVRGAKEMGNDKPFKYLRMDSINMEGGLNTDGLKRVDASPADLSKYGLRLGDLLFNTRNSKELVGKTAVVREPFEGIYNNNILRIRFGENYTADFLDAVLRTRRGQSLLNAIKSGTTSVFAIYQRTLMALEVPVPPADLQHQYSSRMREIFAAKKQQIASVEQVSSLFTSLQHRAFRGEL